MAYTKYIDESACLPKQPVLGSTMSSLRANQNEIFTARNVYWSEIHCEMKIDSASIGNAYEYPTGTYYRKMELQGIDLCGAHPTCSGEIWALAWVGTGGMNQDGVLEVRNTTTSKSATFDPFDDASPTWQVATVPSDFWDSSGTNNVLELYGWYDTSSDDVYVAGWYMTLIAP